eukprot:CAMPEP_0117770656 /NCGR_PEP_ID=MMETSP0947-20121206/23967_1 /TAXON_ID=44440 /ORGANISM="Chattonella subsalsa, Strain CCMP2191" /LENGTH=145 /DNA_ID=CAMNT_0005595803 /DNA_START=318 /DNA_END=755 /DNA_ORIENTATION=-
MATTGETPYAQKASQEAVEHHWDKGIATGSRVFLGSVANQGGQSRNRAASCFCLCLREARVQISHGELHHEPPTNHFEVPPHGYHHLVLLSFLLSPQLYQAEAGQDFLWEERDFRGVGDAMDKAALDRTRSGCIHLKLEVQSFQS